MLTVIPRDWVRLFALSGLVAVVAFVLVGRPWLNNDTLWALVWAGEILHGEAPSFNEPQSSTPHPLSNALAVALRSAGWWVAYWGFGALVLLLYGAMVALTYGVGRACFSPPVGVLSAALVATAPMLLDAGTSASMDLGFIVLVLLSVYLQVRGWRAAAVMSVLALAGLVRPEGWLLAGVYWLWCVWRAEKGLVLLAGVAATAPTLWILIDLAVTGNPLHSLTHTQEGAKSLVRDTGLANVPRTAVNGLAGYLTAPVLLGGSLGFVAAAIRLPRSRPLLAAGLLIGAAYVAIGAAHLSLISRYLVLPSIVLAVAFSFALLGWRDHDHRTVRRVWAASSLGLAVLTTLYLPDRLSDLRSSGDKAANNVALVEDLSDLENDERAMRLLAGCDTILVRDPRPRALLSGMLGRPIERVQDARDVAQTRSAAFVTVREPVIARQELALFPTRPPVPPAERPTGQRVVYTEGVWEISIGSSCRSGSL